MSFKQYESITASKCLLSQFLNGMLGISYYRLSECSSFASGYNDIKMPLQINKFHDFLIFVILLVNCFFCWHLQQDVHLLTCL